MQTVLHRDANAEAAIQRRRVLAHAGLRTTQTAILQPVQFSNGVPGIKTELCILQPCQNDSAQQHNSTTLVRI